MLCICPSFYVGGVGRGHIINPRLAYRCQSKPVFGIVTNVILKVTPDLLLHQTLISILVTIPERRGIVNAF